MILFKKMYGQDVFAAPNHFLYYANFMRFSLLWARVQNYVESDLVYSVGPREVPHAVVWSYIAITRLHWSNERINDENKSMKALTQYHPAWRAPVAPLRGYLSARTAVAARSLRNFTRRISGERKYRSYRTVLSYERQTTLLTLVAR